jgi:predicted HNH restriction endonuclease
VKLTSFLMTWKESGWPHENVVRMADALRGKGYVDEPWRIKAHTKTAVGDRVWVLRQGRGPKGVFGAGRIIGAPALGDAGNGETQMMVDVRFEAFVDPKQRFLIDEDSMARVLKPQQIRAQASGYRIDDEQSAALEELLARGSVNAGGDWTKTEIGRNATWTRDELILALDLYVQFRGNPPGKASSEVIALSRLLNQLTVTIGAVSPDFRNPNGVYMKLMNFRRFDPVYWAQGKSGLTRGSKLEEVVWNEFASAPVRLSQTAEAIKANVLNLPHANLKRDEIVEAEEGRILTRAHLVRERSRTLVDAKKQEALKATGRLACEVCGFDFEAIYGERGGGFIEAHHVLPLHQLLPGAKTKLADLGLLCANCHRMVHSRRPWLTIDQLRNCLGRAELRTGR